MAKDKKLKKQKEKMPSIFKYLGSKSFLVAVIALVAGIGVGVAISFTYKNITNDWVLWILQIAEVVIFMTFAISIIFSIVGATGRRGKAFYDAKEAALATA